MTNDSDHRDLIAGERGRAEERDFHTRLLAQFGNLFIIGFEGLIVGIQTMRLHYYEILGKFFHGGGMRFEPLTLTPRKEDV